MVLFGDKFQFETKHGDMRNARKNFDSLRWSMVTVFEVFTGDGWNLVLYHAIAATSSWAMLYFAVLIVLGNLVLLNVLVGIVILTFQNISNPNDGSPESDPTHIDHNNRDNGHPSTGSGSEPSRSFVTDPAPALPDITEDNESLSLIQRIVSWCKKHEDCSFYVFSPQNSLLEVIGEAEGKLSLVLQSMRLLRFVKLLDFLPHLKRQLLVLKKRLEEAAGL
ncbi:voltage-dependent T-type calcium channel subunit alpha-1H-like [Notolabrus celidotus]|uniref:voltage-dependent T-type calcium channel subunit alpha-1H-like n=1 Tax=Notolabrus celidotus TaxID=1203425 RepID=UPI00149000EA|nr:voltage-dependent T-type calcium channel subunit alpha-1H-like [Notolabrus celidotus]